MFIPLRDDNPALSIPYVTFSLIGINLAVWLYQFFLSAQADYLFIYTYGVVPGWLTGLADAELPPGFFPRLPTLVTSQFLHAGVLHLGGNMLYLWIFGNNIEDLLGHIRFLAFYLIGGVLAGLSHVVAGPSSQVPMIGASGAVAAVLGAYLLYYPRAKVTVLLWLIVIAIPFQVPALVVLVSWFLLQIFGIGGEGVAWMAHIGGFVAGIVLVRYFLPKGAFLPPPPPLPGQNGGAGPQGPTIH